MSAPDEIASGNRSTLHACTHEATAAHSVKAASELVSQAGLLTSQRRSQKAGNCRALTSHTLPAGVQELECSFYLSRGVGEESNRLLKTCTQDSVQAGLESDHTGLDAVQSLKQQATVKAQHPDDEADGQSLAWISRKESNLASRSRNTTCSAQHRRDLYPPFSYKHRCRAL